MALIDETQNLDATNPRIPLIPDALSSSKVERPLLVPFVMPTEQEYYWRSSWQTDERAALAEREAGEVFRFDSEDSEDAARFLDEGDIDGE